MADSTTAKLYILGHPDIEAMPERMTPLIKRLRYRAHHMGTQENDLLFGTFADRHLADFDEAQLARFQALLEENDPNLFDWVTGRKRVPARHDHDVLQLLRSFRLVGETS